MQVRQMKFLLYLSIGLNVSFIGLVLIKVPYGFEVIPILEERSGSLSAKVYGFVSYNFLERDVHVYLEVFEENSELKLARRIRKYDGIEVAQFYNIEFLKGRIVLKSQWEEYSFIHPIFLD